MDTCRYNNTKRNKQAVQDAFGEDINIYDFTIPNQVALAEASSEGFSLSYHFIIICFSVFWV